MANGTKKKEKKAKTETETETKAAALPDNANAANQTGQSEPKKKNGCLVAAIFAIAFFLLIGALVLFWLWPFIFSFFMDLRSGDISLPKTTQTQNAKGTLTGKNLSSLIDPSKTVTKRISAKNGGQITVRTASGLYFTLKIAPGALEKDTDITLTPISESPIVGYPNPDDPGVVIGPENTNLGDGSTMTVSEDPPVEPADPSSSGADPGTNPDGGTTNPPGTPPETPPDTPPGTPPTAPPGTSGELPDLSHLADLLGNNNTMTTTPSGNPSGQSGSGTTGNTGSNRDDRNTGSGSSDGGGTSPGRFSDKTVIISTGYGGGVSGAPTSHSDDGDSATAPIDETGGTTVDDPDESEAEDLAKNAAEASGGTCTPEFISAIKAMADIPGYPAGSIMARTLDDCLTLEWLRDKCQNDPIALRRLYFKERLRIAADLQAPAEKVEEINRLMNECVARYEISSSGSDSSLGVPMSATANLWVCGYLDDVWQGTMAYQIVPPGLPGAGHYFSGTVNSMNLPPRGGTFAAEAAPDSHSGGAGLVDLSNMSLGLWGYFDGQSTLNPLNIYVVAVDNVPIDMTQRPCVPLTPLAP